MKSSHVCERTLAVSVMAFCIGLMVTPAASADDLGTDPSSPGPVVVTPVDPSGQRYWPQRRLVGHSPRLDGSSNYYGEFADSFEGSDYSDPAVDSSNAVGRTALRQSAGVAMDAANTPGLQPDRRTDADLVARRNQAARQDGAANSRRQSELHRHRDEQPS